MKKKVTYIVSDIDKAIAFEWIIEAINKEKIDLSFVLINGESSYLYQYLEKANVSVYLISCKKKKNIFLAVIQCCKLLNKLKSDIVHCHLFMANIVGLIAARILGIKSRIHTRHHSDYHHVYYPRSVKYDKFVNWLSTDIIAISKVVENILITKENVVSSKIKLIHHGFKLMDYSNPYDVNVMALKSKYNPEENYPVIGVISRYTEWKGIQYILPAFIKFLEIYPNALLVLANATGDYKDELHKLLAEIPERNFVEIKFENDIFSLYQLFDIFTHVPISKSVEAFGQTYVEALASGIPSVFTLSGIAKEFILDKQNALVVPYKNSEAIYFSWIELMNNKDLRDQLILNGRNNVSEKFRLNVMISKLEQLYNE